MILFLVGVLEMVIVTAWTKVVTENKVMASGAITMVNINWKLVVLYALGCAVGTVISTYYFNRKEGSRGRLAEQA